VRAARVAASPPALEHDVEADGDAVVVRIRHLVRRRLAVERGGTGHGLDADDVVARLRPDLVPAADSERRADAYAEGRRDPLGLGTVIDHHKGTVAGIGLKGPLHLQGLRLRYGKAGVEPDIGRDKLPAQHPVDHSRRERHRRAGIGVPVDVPTDLCVPQRPRGELETAIILETESHQHGLAGEPHMVSREIGAVKHDAHRRPGASGDGQ
jgi:hypothetical protein